LPGQFNISRLVTNHIGTREVERKIRGRSMNHGRLWLPATTAVIRVMRAIIDGIKARSARFKAAQQDGVDRL
jgi:hypothetical protein